MRIFVEKRTASGATITVVPGARSGTVPMQVRGVSREALKPLLAELQARQAPGRDPQA